MRIVIIAAALALAACQPTVPAPSDAAGPDASPRWQRCEGCRIECEYGRGRIIIVPVMPADPLEPVPDCTGCEGFCAPPGVTRDAGPDEYLRCVPIEGPLYEPSCDGTTVIPLWQTETVWRDTWR